MLRFSRDLATTHVPVILTALLLLAIGYLLGAIPSGYLAGRWLKGIDLRECGSCLLYTSPSPRDGLLSRMPSSA